MHLIINSFSQRINNSDWVQLYNTAINPSSGIVATIPITGNQTNVQLKFTNLAPTQNAYLNDLTIYGMVSAPAPPTVSSLTPATNSNIPVSGTVSVVFSENITRNSSNDITIAGGRQGSGDVW